MFPRAPDQHKPNRPLVPNGLGVIYVLISATYLFLLNYFHVSNGGQPNTGPPALTLAVCVLFGGFMGLLDDWMDLRWRYKAFLPILASLPLVALREGTPEMSTYFWGKINFQTTSFWIIPGEIVFFFIIIPLIVTITTNTINQLGGLNGLETLCPFVVLFGLLLASPSGLQVLLYVPLLIYLVLALFNLSGRIFVGNTGSFAIGITIASYALIANVEQTLVISILPYIFNSSIILLTFFFLRSRAQVSFDGKRLSSDHRRSLVTLVTYRRSLTERQTVLVISLLVAVSTFAALLVQRFTL